jgi:magnesium transporter
VAGWARAGLPEWELDLTVRDVLGSTRMIGSLIQPELRELIERRDFASLRDCLAGFQAPDLAELLCDLDPAETAVTLRVLPHAVAADAFEYLPLTKQEQLIHALGDREVAAILDELAADDRTALLEELPARVTQKLLTLLSPDERRIASQLLGYPKNSVGRRMTPEYVAIEQAWTANDVLAHLRHVGPQRERLALNQLYVVDAAGHLVDWVRLGLVVSSPPERPVAELLEGTNWSLLATDDQSVAVEAFKKYDVTVLPVVDTKGVLLGVVTVDDMLDVAERQSTEEIQRLGGLEALDAPYLDIGLFSMVKKRAGWLSLLFMGELLTATAMNHFQDELGKALVLSSFLPLIISSGGNSGSQATSLIIRSLAVGDVALRDWWRVLRRELIAGMLLGCALAALGFSRIWLWQLLGFYNYGPHHGLIAATVACSLVGVVLFGSLIGAMLPFLLRSIRLDPAVASAPLVATLVDVTGLVIYFTIAFLILRGTLL